MKVEPLNEAAQTFGSLPSKGGLFHEDIDDYTPQASDYLVQTLARIDKDLTEEKGDELNVRLSQNLRTLDDLCTNLKLSLLD